MIEKNYKIHMSLQGQQVSKDFKVKALVDDVLTKSGFKDKRARTMDIDDFMKLLHAFNSEGLHFA